MPSKQRRDELDTTKLQRAKLRLRERRQQTEETLKRLQGQQPQKPDIL